MNEYWERYRTTPKAFVSLATGQRLWRSRYGAVTSIRIAAAAAGRRRRRAATATKRQIRAKIDPLSMGMAVVPVRTDAHRRVARRHRFRRVFRLFQLLPGGVGAAARVAVLQARGGAARARGRPASRRRIRRGDVRRLFMTEGLVVAVAGSALGVAGAVAYAALLMFGLRTWWVDAVGTTALTLHVDAACRSSAARWAASRPRPAASGGRFAGSRARLRAKPADGADRKRHASAARKGRAAADQGRAALSGVAYAAVGLALAGVVLIGAGAAGAVERTGAFFGGGTALLGAALCAAAALLRRRSAGARGLTGHGWQPVSALGMRNAAYRPGRSVLSIAVIASATFILISVDAFRRDEGAADRRPPIGRRRIHAGRRDTAPDRPRSEHARRPRRAQPA